MKKILALMLLAGMLLTVTGCFGGDEHTEHTWVDANCQSPQKCSVCGVTEGELGDHSTKLGTCVHCNTYQNKDTFDSISDKVTSISTALKPAYDLIVEKTTAYPNDEFVYAALVNTAAPTFDNEKANLEELVELCADYTELADFKAKIESAIQYHPTNTTETDLESTKAYLTNAKLCYMYVLEAASLLQNIT